MNTVEFKRILTAFADRPADLDVSRGQLLVQIRDEVITARLDSKEGELYVSEGGDLIPAIRWIITRVARLPRLADRILEHLPSLPHFVVPKGSLLDQLDYAPEEADTPVNDALEAAQAVLSRRPPGTSSILYLTSDAGEGKSTLINQLCIRQAQTYKDKKSDWLLVPIALGGRPFLRFDEVIISALVSRLRFSYLYYEAFIELVRLGVIVPALDGFEEMFVESPTGDAVSALGTLVHTMQSSGSVLIAARKPYFDYKSLITQARLFDALHSSSVSFSRLSLARWGREEFVRYGQKRLVTNTDQIYDDVSERLGWDHPLLTRAVLVRRLFDVATKIADRSELLRQLGTTPEDYFATFVDAIVKREAEEKWIDKAGEAAQPLLSVQEHHDLLATVAHEMWSGGSASLREEELRFVAELFCEEHSKPQVVSRQVIERIKQHALITQADPSLKSFTFDHEQFYHFYLGRAVGRLLIRRSAPDIREILRRGALPSLVLDVASNDVRRNESNLAAISEFVTTACRPESPASFSRENAGGLVVRILDGIRGDICVLEGLSFPPNSLLGRRLHGLHWVRCRFQPTALDETELVHCTFEECTVERLEIGSGVRIDNVAWKNTTCLCLIPVESEIAIYDPHSIMQHLIRLGIKIPTTELTSRESTEERVTDDALALALRTFRAFLRGTEINETVFRQRLGTKSGDFFSQILPVLLESQIMKEVPYHGAGKQRRFRLNAHLHEIQEALRDCDGQFEEFVRRMRKG